MPSRGRCTRGSLSKRAENVKVCLHLDLTPRIFLSFSMAMGKKTCLAEEFLRYTWEKSGFILHDRRGG
jgi:hypothetical protein